MSARILKGLYQVTVYTIGISVLLAAVTATLVRVLLPDIGMYRSEIEAWVSNYMEFPVAIRNIKADWQGWTPYLYLEDIDLLNKAGTRTIIKFESAQVSIDPLATLMLRQIVPDRLVISGFELDLTRLEDGSIDVAGLASGKNQQHNMSNSELAEWLFGQRLIELQNVQIKWLDETLGQAPVLLSEVDLVLRSDGNRVQVEGTSLLPSMYGERLSFAVDVTGNLLSTNWAAELYLQGSNINPDFWYRQYWPAEVNVSGGNATITTWSSWKDGSVQSMKGQMQYSNFEFGSFSGKRLAVEQLSTRFNSVRNSDNSWLVNVSIDHLVTANGSWEPTQISLLARPDAPSYTVNFNFLKMDDLYQVITTLPQLPDNITTLAEKYPLRGELRDGRILYRPQAANNERLQFDITVSEMGMPSSETTPVISGLSARIQGNVDNGRITFSDENAVVEYSSVEARETLPIAIHGQLSWASTNTGYILFTDKLGLRNDELVTRLAGSIGISGKCCYIDMIAETDPVDVDTFIRHIPYTRSFRLRDWLQKSVRDGQVQQARAVFRGNTAAFPFDQHVGVFELALDVSGASLEYSPRWPVIKDITGQVGFAGRQMIINITSGKIFDAAISTATATIPDIFPRQKTVNIDGQIHGVTNDLKKYIGQSPLGTNQMLSKLVTSLSADGNVDLGLQLSVPIRTPDLQTTINGRLQLDNTVLTTDLQGLQFSDIDGVVSFTRNSISAENISAIYDNNPISLSVQGSDTDVNNPVTVVIHGTGDNAFITNQINHYFPGMIFINDILAERLSGSTDWQASLSHVKTPGQTGMQRTLKISSDLYGMNVKLPQPLTKHAYKKIPLEIIRNLDNPEAPLKIRYGNILTSEIFSDSINGLQRADINFGNKTYMYPDHDGVLLFGAVSEMAPGEWMDLIGTSSSGQERELMTIQADLEFDNLHFFGQTFRDIKVRAGHDLLNWNIGLSSESVSGSLTIPLGTDKEQPIIVDLDYLRLARGSSDTNSKPVIPSKLRSISAQVDSFSYAGLDLGEMVFVAGAADYGLYIDTMSFTKPLFTIEATGKWNGTDGVNNSSDFTIQAHATEFNSMLQTFGYDVAAVKKGEANFAIDANWSGTPMDFSLDKLNGTLGLKIGKGQLLDIQPSAGRLFGLLSLQTLPRRLTLDFSDLFGDGMAFDVIEGNFVIRNGDAYTDDLIMKGPSVDISISGRTGLSTHDYDQTAVITPQISDSLAVASGFLGPMGLGLGTVLYLAGNMFEPLQDSINKIMKFKYSISGSWNDPVIEKQRDATKSSG